MTRVIAHAPSLPCVLGVGVDPPARGGDLRRGYGERPSPGGGTGRRRGLKPPSPSGRVGSSPTPGTVRTMTIVCSTPGRLVLSVSSFWGFAR